jgi:hypothetical protein
MPLPAMICIAWTGLLVELNPDPNLRVQTPRAAHVLAGLFIVTLEWALLYTGGPGDCTELFVAARRFPKIQYLGYFAYLDKALS